MAFPTQSASLVRASSQELTAIDSASLSITGNIAVECWVKATTWASADQNILLAKDDAGTSRNWKFFVMDIGGGDFRLGMNIDQTGNNTVTTNVTGTQNLATYTGAWHHFAVSWTAGLTNIPSLFIDGVADTASASSGLAATIGDSNVVTRIGNQGGTTRYLNGRIVMARVWSTTRTATDFSNNWCTALGTTTNLAAEWTLDNTLNDNSGNSNTLTNVNSVTFGADVPATCSAVVTHFLSLLGAGA